MWPIRPSSWSGDDAAAARSADVYIGFGTIPAFANASDELIAAVGTCTARGLRVVVTAPDDQLRVDLAAIDRDLVDVHEFVSLSSLLATCRLVISHAGAGTVLAALSAGVPLVVIPRGSPSQGRMAQACERAGVGRSCTDAADIEGAVDDMLTAPTFTSRARHAARQIAAMPAAAVVAQALEQFASHHT